MAPESGRDAFRAERARRAAAAARSAGLPSLHLLIWPTPSCVRLSLVIYYTTPGQRRTCTVLRQAEWTPKEVTPTKLVEWGMRAMSDWLAEPTFKAIGQEPRTEL